MKIGRSRSAFANSSMEWNTSSGRSSSWSHFQKTIILCVSSSQFITFFVKVSQAQIPDLAPKTQTTQTDWAKKTSLSPTDIKSHMAPIWFSDVWSTHMSWLPTGKIFKTSSLQFHFRRSSSSRRLAWKSPVSSIVSGSLESESPSTDIYWSNGSVVRPPTMSIANEVKTSLKISCPWKVKTRWSTNNESQLFSPGDRVFLLLPLRGFDNNKEASDRVFVLPLSITQFANYRLLFKRTDFVIVNNGMYFCLGYRERFWNVHCYNVVLVVPEHDTRSGTLCLLNVSQFSPLPSSSSTSLRLPL